MTTVTSPGVRAGEATREGGVAFGFCVSHAPQIFTQPKEEDPAELSRMHEGYRTVARRAREQKVDALIIVALDHLHNHFLNLVPQFTLFTGEPGGGAVQPPPHRAQRQPGDRQQPHGRPARPRVRPRVQPERGP